MSGHSILCGYGLFLSHELCPRCDANLRASNAGARKCPGCTYSRPVPPVDAKRLAIYGDGGFERYRDRVDHMLANVQLGPITGAPSAIFASRYARYRAVNFSPIDAPPKLFLECSDIFIAIGPSKYLDEAVKLGMPHRLLR